MYRIFKRDEAEKFAGGDIFKEFRTPEPEAETAEIKEEPQEPDPSLELIAKGEAAFRESMRKAEETLKAAHMEAEKIKRKAFEDAWDKGYNKGLEEGRSKGGAEAYKEAMSRYNEKFTADISALENAIEKYAADMEMEKENILHLYIDNLKDISIAIGEKIVMTSLKSSEDVVKRMILAATEKLKKTAWAKIYIAGIKNGTDIKGDAQFLHSLSKLSSNVKIIVLDNEEPGTCIIELPDEIIDVSFKSQLENIKEILYNARV